MAVSLKHNFQSAIADGGDANLVQPSNWNEEHVLTCATNKVLGRATAGTGAVEELDCTAFARTLLDDADAATARTTLGLGTAATAASTDFANAAAWARCTSANALADNTNPQAIFPAGFDAFTAEGSTTYLVEAEIFLTTGANAHSVGVSFGGTATYTSVYYRAMGVKAATGSLSVNINNRRVDVATNATVTSSNNTAGAIISIRGHISVNAGGTIIPTITFSAAPGGAPNQVEPGTFVRFVKVGTDTATSAGAWA